ncbi:MAG: DUF2797 domain-containing protein [Acidiferrobacterales bacterium]
MKVAGNIRKMVVSLESPVHYQLPVGDELVPLNDYIGKNISLTYTGLINCIACGRKTSKSFSQGYCFPCMRSLARCDQCIVRPELCHYAAGTCREPAWGDENCIQPHIVYLANSSGVKVGITRVSQIPTRWIDQGASAALPILQAKSRLLSGLAEMVIKKHVSDRTDWRRMLKGRPDPVDLLARRDHLLNECDTELDIIRSEHGDDSFTSLEEEIVNIDFPVNTYPEKVSSLNFDKMPVVSGALLGIKGQYLIFDSGVINIRKFAGYHLQVNLPG